MMLFDPVRLRGCELRNRIVMAPMSQHRAGKDGLPTDWHLAHYGARGRGLRGGAAGGHRGGAAGAHE
jgi:2,4-dienoyl-CoA reductase-like NADH-dependent reductase (Old Yellow Enzyme family)